MAEKKNEAAPAGTGTTSAQSTKLSLSPSYIRRQKKSSQLLKDLRKVHGISADKVVRAAHRYAPNFDRSSLSKAENGQKYGMLIPLELIGRVYADLVPNVIPDLKVPDYRTMPNRVAVRLNDDDYISLVELQELNGFDTMQDFLTVIIRKVIKEGI